MRIERRNISDLYTDPANARRHGPKNLETIKASLRRFGQQHPLVVNEDGMVVAGNGRLVAMGALGWSECDVVVTDLTGLDLAAFGVADNRTAELAEWDADALAVVLEALNEDDDLSPEDAGFDTATMSETLEAMRPEQPAEPKEVVEDEAPEPLADATTRTGDVWVLDGPAGAHRVLCGDSTDAEAVARVTGGETPGLMVTDPPYGVEYDPSWRSVANNDGPNCKRALGVVENDWRADWREAWALFVGDVAYIWHANIFSPAVAESLIACDFELRYLLVWAKSQHSFGRGHYHHKHEPCWMAVRKGKTAGWIGGAKQATLWEIDKNRNNETGHSTQKPVECMARPIRNHDAALVFDPFLGSGTTLIAAEQLGRRCVGLELEPRYVDVIVRRWQKLTGKAATLEGDGRTFDEIDAERRGSTPESLDPTK
jgi:DNA modification methylase